MERHVTLTEEKRLTHIILIGKLDMKKNHLEFCRVAGMIILKSITKNGGAMLLMRRQDQADSLRKCKNKLNTKNALLLGCHSTRELLDQIQIYIILQSINKNR
jgi:hypothetical protein